MSSLLSVTTFSPDCSSLCSLSLLCCGIFLHCHWVWFHGPDDDKGSPGVKETWQPDEVSCAPPHIVHHGRGHYYQGVWKRRCIQEEVSVDLMIEKMRSKQWFSKSKSPRNNKHIHIQGIFFVIYYTKLKPECWLLFHMKGGIQIQNHFWVINKN